MTVFDRLTRVIAPAFVVLASAHIASAQTTAPAAGEDPVVAVVDGKEIHFSEVAEVQRNLPDQFQMLPLDAIFATLVERLIDLQLVVVEGRKANLQDDEVVKRRMTQIEDRVIRDIYVSRHVDEVMTEEVLLARYDEFKRRNPPQDELRARHILVASEEEAKAAIAEIAGGADFADVATERSTGPSSDRGGDIGYFTRDAVVPEFADAAFALQPGEVSETPVETSFGWHVIKVEDRRLGEVPSFEETRVQLVAEASEEAVSELMTTLREAAMIERFNMDGSPIDTAAEPGATVE